MDEPEIRVTRHARQRIKERLGLPARAAQRLAERALGSGLSREQVGADLRRLIDAKAFYSPAANGQALRVYRNAIFVFSQAAAPTSLLTVLPLLTAEQAPRAAAAKLRRGALPHLSSSEAA